MRKSVYTLISIFFSSYISWYERNTVWYLQRAIKFLSLLDKDLVKSIAFFQKKSFAYKGKMKLILIIFLDLKERRFYFQVSFCIIYWKNKRIEMGTSESSQGSSDSRGSSNSQGSHCESNSSVDVRGRINIPPIDVPTEKKNSGNNNSGQNGR